MSRKALNPPVFSTVLLLLCTLICSTVHAQNLEPRRWSHLPTNLNVFGIAAVTTDSDILFDPVMRIEDAKSDVSIATLSYVRTFDFFGKSGRFDVIAPYASGRWEGLVDGVDRVVHRRGFTDPFVRFSVNFYGSPPLDARAFMQYRREHPVNTTIGAAIGIGLPLGDYNDLKLINLGDNRFVVRPQLGVLHQHYKWQFEVTGSVFLYQDNNEFWNGNELDQDPLWFLQGHVIYDFKPGWWASFSAGYAYGGRSHINGVPKEDDRRTNYFAISLGMPINARQGLKFTYFSSDTNISVGSNSDALLVAWSINWGS